MDSILDSVKKNLGLASDYTPFDPDILMYINSTFAILNQLGIGPEAGFAIEDKDATWDTYIGTDLKLNLVKTYIFIKVKMLFDPAQTSYLITAWEKQLEELEARLQIKREGESWTPPTPPPTTEDCW